MMSSPLPARGWIRVSIVLAVLLALSALGFNGGAVSARTQWQRGARLEAIRTPFSESVAQMGRRDLQWRAQILAENIPPSALANPVEPWEGEEEEREREREGRANAAPQGFFQAATVPTPQTIGSAFQGFGMQDQVSRFSAWSYPPDTSGAIGPNHFVQVINGSVAFYNKSGVAAANPIRLNTFFNFTFQGVTYPRNGGFDPRVVYDRQSGRWFACALEFGPLVGGLGSANHLLLAVSRSSDPTTIWDKYVIPVGDPNQVVGGNQIASFTDYPTLGMDSNGVYAVVRIFAFNVNTGSVVMTSAKIVAMPKASLLAASPSLGTLSQWARIQDMFSTPQPALNLDPVGAGDPAWLFSSSPGSPSLLYRKITWSGGTPQLSNTATLPTPVVSLQIPSAPASGSVGANAINTGDVRLQSATIRGGRLWTSRNVCVNANGTHSGSDPGNRTACEWFEINVSGSTPTLVQNGRVWDPATADPWFYYFPSIMVNGQGHAVIAFSGSKNSEFVGAFYAGRLATDPPGTMGTPVVLRSGVAPYNQLDLNDPPRNRWGDYSYTSLDPSDTMSLWTIQEYAEAPSTPVGNPPVASRWGTRVARLASPPPVLDSPNVTLEQGQSNVTLPLTGTGFYDPGAGFTGRLSVQVGGGSPPGIDNLQFTYNGPTSITLRFDVAANAGGGPRSITVTNPDGQTATVASAFSVGVPATVQLSSSTYPVPETGGTATITANRTGLTTDPLTVEYATTDGTATSPADYTGMSGVLTFAAGQTSQIFTVAIAPDRLLEGPQTVQLTLSNPTGALLGSPASAILTIADDTSAPAPTDLTATVVSANAITLAWTDRCDNEDLFQIERKVGGGAFSELSTTGADVTSFTDPGPFAAGSLYTYRVRAVRGALRSDYSGEVAAVPTTIQFASAATTASEEGGLASVVVSRAGSTAGTSTAQVAVTGGTAGSPDDYILGTTEVSFAPGETVQTVTVSLIPDLLLEGGETVLLTLSSPTGLGVTVGSQATTTLTIADGLNLPAPTGLTAQISGTQVVLNWVDHCANELGFRIERRADAGEFTPLDTVASDVTTYTDVEPNRGVLYTYRVRAMRGQVASALSNTATAALDGVRFELGAFTVTEGDSSVLIFARRVGSTAGSASVVYQTADGTATAGADYTAEAGVLTFMPGQATASFIVSVATDAAIESDETVLLTLRSPVGTELGDPSSAVLTIRDLRSATRPTEVTAIPVGASHIRVAWTDRSSNETGFRVHRAEGAGGYTPLGMAAAGSTTYDDTTVSGGTTYHYRVVAVADTAEADLSNIATATIPVGGKFKVGPAKLNFGKLKLGKSKQLKLKLTNSGKGTLAGFVGSVPAPFTLVSGGGAFILAPKKSLTVLVRYDASQAGTAETSLTITSTDPARPSVTVPVKSLAR